MSNIFSAFINNPYCVLTIEGIYGTELLAELSVIQTPGAHVLCNTSLPPTLDCGLDLVSRF